MKPQRHHLLSFIFKGSSFGLRFRFGLPFGLSTLAFIALLLALPFAFQVRSFAQTFVANSVQSSNVTKSGLFQRNGWLQAHSTIQTFHATPRSADTLGSFSSGKREMIHFAKLILQKPDNVKVASCRS